MQPCPAGAWGSGPWNAGSRHSQGLVHWHKGSTMFFWDSQPCLSGYLELLLHLDLQGDRGTPWACEKLQPSSFRAFASPRHWVGWWGVLTEPLHKGAGYLLRGHFLHSASLSFLRPLVISLCMQMGKLRQQCWITAKAINKITMKTNPFNSCFSAWIMTLWASIAGEHSLYL